MSELDAVRKIGEVVVGAGGLANIPFSNIPQTFRSLALRVTGRSDAATTQIELRVQCNADTSASYTYADVYGGSLGPTSELNTTSTYLRFGWIPGATAAAGNVGMTDAMFANPFNTSLYKIFTCLNFREESSVIIQMIAGQWHSTAAITSLLLFPSGGNFVNGSVCSLYGIL